MNVLLISENTLKANSLVCDNVDGTYLQAAIENSQVQHLQPLLGTLLYNRICSDVAGDTLDTNYKLLLDEYITPFLIQQTLSDMIIPLLYKFRNAGMMTNTDDHSSAASMSDAQHLQQYYADKAAFYGNRLFDYLVQEHNTYKEFLTCKKYADMHSNRLAGYKTNIYLGR